MSLHYTLTSIIVSLQVLAVGISGFAALIFFGLQLYRARHTHSDADADLLARGDSNSKTEGLHPEAVPD